MRLIETSRYFLIDQFFPPSIIAGYTKASFPAKFSFDFRAILASLAKEADFCWMNQKHTARIFFVQKPGVYGADGLFTAKKNLFLVVKSADCLPIFLAAKNKWAGIIHMGWRPAKKGILKNIPIDLSEFKAFAGVGLRDCCFRVGDEFTDYRELSFCLKKTSSGLFFNPIKFAKAELVNLGLSEGNFFDSGLCSFCSKKLFFSWRRDKTARRTLSFLGIIK